jgi:Vacuolar protein sorting-associated protein 62
VSADSERLLHRHKPFLKYDSHECYFADSAAEWTDSAGNRLERAGGKVLAAAAGAAGAADLSLALLGPSKYADRESVHRTDLIADRATDRDYVRQANLLHQDPRYRNRIYGHAATDSAGELWLQYWFFYFYNDFNLIGDLFGAGRHEGDWEMIQLRVGADGSPDLAAFAQHKHAEVRRWDQVDLIPGTEQPIVYVARGSHASYFEPGPHSTGAWVDWADGKRRSPRLTLEIADDALPQYRWLLWPGHWGGTKPGFLPFDADSPVGPGAHGQWRDPLALVPELETTVPAAASAPLAVPPSLPRAIASRTADGGLAIAYEASPVDADRLRGLVITVNSPDEASPPATRTVALTDPVGTAEPAIPLDPAKRYDVYTSAVFADHVATGSVRSDLAPARP